MSGEGGCLMDKQTEAATVLLRETVDTESRALKQELRHLIYPLNYSSKTPGLISSQERVSAAYDTDFDAWRSRLLDLDIEPKEMAEWLYAVIARLGYDSRTRSLLVRLVQRLRLKPSAAHEVEAFVLANLTENDSASLVSSAAQFSESLPWSRRKWLFATAGVVLSTAACGLSAGLAAPIVVPAVLSAVGLSGAATLAASAGGITVMASLFGLAGAGMAGFRINRRFADLNDFEFRPLNVVDRSRRKALRVTITISGWLQSEADVMGPWIDTYLRLIGDPGCAIQQDTYCLAFERKFMLSLGSALQDFITSSAVTFAAAEVFRVGISAAATSALMLPVAVLQAGDLVDNPWTLGLDRARKAGRALAFALLRGCQGRRPLTLVGYSLGALVIFSCLQELASLSLKECGALQKDGLDSLVPNNSPELQSAESSSSDLSIPELAPSRFGIIENVVLMGLPAHVASPSVWNQLKLLVSGRFVHCYSRNDWLLRFLYRSSNLLATEIAGINPIAESPVIESVNLSNLVRGHLDYPARLPEIMQILGI